MENGGKNHTTIGSNYIFLNRIGLRRILYYIIYILLSITKSLILFIF